MATYRFVAYDIEKSLKKTFDDADITLPQIVYWIQVVANQMRRDIYSVDKTDMFVSTYKPVPVLTDQHGNKYVDLPVQILNLSNNGGIVYMSYNEKTCCCEGPVWAQRPFQTTNLGSAQSLYGDPYTKPSPKNPYYYRVGDKVDGVKVNRLYLLGLECTDVADLQIALLGTLDPSKVCDLDEDLNLPEEYIHELIIQVLSLGRFISMVPSENVNQGSDDSAPIQNAVPTIPDSDQ